MKNLRAFKVHWVNKLSNGTELVYADSGETIEEVAEMVCRWKLTHYKKATTWTEVEEVTDTYQEEIKGEK